MLPVCLLAAAIPLADMSVVNIALPRIVSDLGLGVVEANAVVALHAIAFGVVLVPAGRLGDRIGQRRVMTIGLALFTLGAFASACAPSAWWLIAARTFQGVAAGLLSPQVSGMLQRVFSGQARAAAFGAMGATIAVTIAAGPSLGGLVLGLGGESGWRWLMLLGVLAVVPLLGRRVLPRDVSSGARDHDGTAQVLTVAIALCALLPLVLGPLTRWTLAWLALPVLVAALVRHERQAHRRGANVLLAPSLVRDAGWVRGCVLITFYLAGSTAAPLLVSLHAQVVLGASELWTGLVTLPYALSSGVAAILGGRWVLRHGDRVLRLGCVGFVLPLLVLVAAGLTEPDVGTTGAVVAVALLAVTGFGNGLVISPNQTLTFRDVASDQASNASGWLLTAQRVGGASGAAIVTTVFFLHAPAGRADQLLPEDAGTSAAVLVTCLFGALALLALMVLPARASARESGRSAVHASRP